MSSTRFRPNKHDERHLDALTPLARALAPLVAAELLKLGAAAPLERPFSQLDGERPPGCKRSKFLRVWGLARDAGDPGATEHGRARLLTSEAFQRFATTRTATAKPPKADPDARALTLLGLAPRRAS